MTDAASRAERLAALTCREADWAGLRVVVTGLGETTALGGDVSTTWHAMLRGESGVVRLEDEPWSAEMPPQIGGRVRVEPGAGLEHRQRRRLSHRPPRHQEHPHLIYLLSLPVLLHSRQQPQLRYPGPLQRSPTRFRHPILHIPPTTVTAPHIPHTA